ncbi:hypothetical protein BJ508DRAFT_333688 [Ascobolus immersus RN42]|uniref:Uncharacterized protein n=1 Tax=Ascobolus immersus RN42 TaxID=1160509 RepID=A0A3N4HW18_ASCIM|nr:hypothetical protein BJ508DRAFT_333688 [Ascobolus immersus RN42]
MHDHSTTNVGDLAASATENRERKDLEAECSNAANVHLLDWDKVPSGSLSESAFDTAALFTSSTGRKLISFMLYDPAVLKRNWIGSGRYYNMPEKDHGQLHTVTKQSERPWQFCLFCDCWEVDYKFSLLVSADFSLSAAPPELSKVKRVCIFKPSQRPKIPINIAYDDVISRYLLARIDRNEIVIKQKVLKGLRNSDGKRLVNEWAVEGYKEVLSSFRELRKRLLKGRTNDEEYAVGNQPESYRDERVGYSIGRGRHFGNPMWKHTGIIKHNKPTGLRSDPGKAYDDYEKEKWYKITEALDAREKAMDRRLNPAKPKPSKAE